MSDEPNKSELIDPTIDLENRTKLAGGGCLVLIATVVTILAMMVLALIPTPAKAAAYEYQWVGQTGHGTINQGTHRPVTLDLKNTGTSAWSFSNFHLGTSRPMDRGSGFNDGWFASNRIKLSTNVSDPGNTTTIQPGQTGRFSFTATPNLPGHDFGGNYNEYFQPVVEGVQWLPDIGIYWQWTVPAPVATLWFGWYGPGCTGWTVACGDQTTAVKDTPSQGFYDSADVNVIRTQLNQMRDAGINVVYINWDSFIGPSQRSTAHSQGAARVMAATIMAEYPTLKFAMFVEPSWGAPQPEAIGSDIYNDFYTNYANHPQYFRFGGKPLIATFYPRVPGGDPRFNVVTYSTLRPGYADYWAWPNQNKGGFMSLMHRFDNTPQCAVYGTCYYLDGNYTGNVWASQKSNLMAQRGAVKLVFYGSWNEYYERQTLEPHTNPDSLVPATHETDELLQFLTTQWRT